MAEALVVVGIVANIVQLVDFGSRVLKRLEGYQSQLGDVPETFHHIKSELPVLLDALRQTELAINLGSTQEKPKQTLLPAVEGCRTQIKLLDEIIAKVLPISSDSRVKRGKKALMSFRYDTKVDKITAAIRGYTQALTYHAVASRGSSGQVISRPLPSSTVPFRRDPHFVNREALTEIFDKSQQPASRVALVGLGGVGKTQLAVEYSYQVRETFPATWVFWVHASSGARFKEGYQKIARRANIAGWDKPDVDILSLVYHWLSDESNGEWIIILDNADDLNIFSSRSTRDTPGKVETALLEFVPQTANGSVVVTSRNRDTAFKLTGSYADIITVQSMTQEQSLTLLQNKLEKSYYQDEAISLAEALDYMPLAITQAAAYISQREPRVTVSGYLEGLRKDDQKREKLLKIDIGDIRRDGTASNSIITTWQISFEYIHRTRPSATRLLSLMCFFDWQEIPESLLCGHYQENNDPMYDFEEDVNMLRNFSLVTADVNGHQFKMHRLVQFSTKKWLELHGKLDIWMVKYVIIMDRNFPVGAYENWKACQTLFPHAQAAAAYRPADENALKAWASLLYKASGYATETGSFQTAHEMCQGALEAMKATLGPDHLATLNTTRHLGYILMRLRQYKKAEMICQQVLNFQKKILGPEHPDTLINMKNIGYILMKVEQYKEAEMIHRQVINIQEKVVGPEHPNTISSINNLGIILVELGQYKEAEEMCRRALNAWEKMFGPEHPRTLHGASTLTSALEGLGRYEEAEAMHRQVLNIQERILGPEHPDTVFSINNLGIVLERQGQYKEAEAMCQQALNIQKKIFGLEHPRTIYNFGHLGCILMRLGQYEEAKIMCQQAFIFGKEIFGPEHPNTVGNMKELGNVLVKLKQYEEAEAIYQQAINIQKKNFGPEYSDMFSGIDDPDWVMERLGMHPSGSNGEPK